MSAYAYIWAQGSHHKVSAETANEVCSSLEQQNKLSAENLVNVSRSQDAPLHDEFEWNDAVAGEEWRKEQARHIIAHIVRVEKTDDDEKPKDVPIRAFFKIVPTENTYTSTDIIVKRQDTRQLLLHQAMAELKAFRRKYAALTVLVKLIESVESEIQQTSFAESV